MREVPRPEPLLAAQGALWERERAPAGAVLQVARTYLVREIEGGLEVIDQHALHERVTYERLKAGLRSGVIAVQRELVPELIELARSEVVTLAEHLAALEKLGIELAVFGPTTIAVHGLPVLLKRRVGPALVRELVAALELANLLDVAECMLASGLRREESRGAHQRTDFPDRDDQRFLHHHVVTRASDGTPRVDRMPVTITRWPPGERVYGR